VWRCPYRSKWTEQHPHTQLTKTAMRKWTSLMRAGGFMPVKRLSSKSSIFYFILFCNLIVGYLQWLQSPRASLLARAQCHDTYRHPLDSNTDVYQMKLNKSKGKASFFFRSEMSVSQPQSLSFLNLSNQLHQAWGGSDKESRVKCRITCYTFQNSCQSSSLPGVGIGRRTRETYHHSAGDANPPPTVCIGHDVSVT